MKRTLQLAAGAGILSLALAITLFFIESKAVEAIATIAEVILVFGFYAIARKEKNHFLEAMSVILILITLGTFAFDSFVLDAPADTADEAAKQYFIMSGTSFGILALSILLFSVAILPLKKQFKRLASWTGSIGILSGSLWFIFSACLVTYALMLTTSPNVANISLAAGLLAALLGAVSMLVTLILQVFLLLRAAKHYKK